MTSIKRIPRKAGRNTGGYVTPGIVTKTGGRTSSTLGTGTKVDSDQRTRADQAFKDLLKNNATDEFSALLSSLGVNYNDELSEAEIADWNHQLATTQLAYEVEKEKRGYNEQMRDEQRIYDSPTNMLARLMGAGISRDAAIQMLSGAGGSSPIQSGDYTAAPGIAPSESNRNAIESKLGIANTVLNGVSAFSSLVGLGFSIPQALYQTQVLKGQAYLTNRDIQALQSTDQAFTILNSIGAGADAFGSASAAISSIEQAAKDGNADAAAFIQSGGIKAIRGNANLASQRFKSLGSSEKGYEYESGRYIHEMRKLDAETKLANISAEKVAAEILNTKAEYENIVASTEYTQKQSSLVESQAKVLEHQADLLEKQSKTEEAKALLIKAQELRQTLENNQVQALQTATADRLEYNNGEMQVVSRTGLEWMTFDALDHLVSDAQIAAKTKNPQYAHACFMRMFSDAQTIGMANALEQLKLSSGLEFYTKYPQQAAMYSALEECGVYNYLNAIRNGVYDYKAGANIFGLNFGVQKTSNTVGDFLDSFK